MPRALLASVFLLGCSDYDLVGNDDPNDVGDSDTNVITDTDGNVVDACGEQTAAPRDVVLNDACDVDYQEGSFTPVVEWTVPGHTGYGPPVAGELNDDNADGVIDSSDTPDVCYVENTGAGVTCIDGGSGRIEFTTTGGRGYWDGLSGMAIGDLEGDGIPELVVANGPTQLVVMDNTGAELWHATASNTSQTFTYPAIADLDGDGFAEVIQGRSIFGHDGQLLGNGRFGVGAVPNASGSYIEASVPAVADMNGDGVPEVVVGNAAYAIDGTAVLRNNLDDGCPAIADMDGDGEPEVVVVNGGRVYTLESDLQPTGWSYSFGSNYLGPPAIDDLDGDGLPEFVVEGANSLIAFHWDGTILWTQTIQDYSGAAGVIMFDFEGDGYPEVVYADETKIHVFNGLDGAIKMESSDHASATGFETPIVADVDGDGHVEIVMLHGGYQNGISVYGDAGNTWPAGRPVWNQHAYTITNINDDLTLPTSIEDNWIEYNNFRSGDAGLPPSSWRDVGVEVVAVCTDACPASIDVMVRVLNQGTEDIPGGLHVIARAGENGPAVAEATINGAIGTGRSSAGVTLTIATADLDGEEPWVEADRNSQLFGYVSECDETNNGEVVTDTCE
jgi:hypothetical protein